MKIYVLFCFLNNHVQWTYKDETVRKNKGKKRKENVENILANAESEWCDDNKFEKYFKFFHDNINYPFRL